MNILVIGNGFDIAHGLPTQYKQFLRFVASSDIDERLQEVAMSMEEIVSLKEEINNLVNDNFWISHFNKESNFGENWIDFEAEISKIIRLLDELRIELKQQVVYNREFISFIDTKYEYLNDIELLEVYHATEDDAIIYEKKQKLLNDLNRLTRCLEIYLDGYVNRLKIQNDSIRGLIEALNIQKVLSFNYTSTFERVYGKEGIEYHYIHGKADVKHTVNSCNMILGIDEYLTNGLETDDNEFIRFKKFFQRIYKGTGVLYKKWVSKIEEDRRIHSSKNYIYVIGHSLDVTDKDVLKEIFTLSNVCIQIYNHDQESMANRISNLVKVIGKENMIDKTYSVNPIIMFCDQK